MNGRPDLSRLTARLAKFWLPALILCLGVVLMLLPGKNRTTQQTPADAAAQTSERFDLTALERQLSGALSEISGVGSAPWCSPSAPAGSRCWRRTPRRAPPPIRRPSLFPPAPAQRRRSVSRPSTRSFRGALVICEGADQAGVKLDVLKAVSAVTGLRSDQISICQRK